MSQQFRLAQGGRIDRSRTLSFQFDGKRYEGHPGDTLASALLANGVRLVGRSFKFHRPRGIFSAGSEEPSALVQVGEEPNCRATEIALYEGLVATAQHAWPTLRFDLAAAAGWIAPLLPAGFYYKMFIRPQAAGSACGSRCCAAWRVLAGRRASRIPRATTRPMRIATCSWSAAARPGWRRRWRRDAAARG